VNVEGLSEILKQVACCTEMTNEKTQSEEEVQVQLKKEMQQLRESLVIGFEIGPAPVPDPPVPAAEPAGAEQLQEEGLGAVPAEAAALGEGERAAAGTQCSLTNSEFKSESMRTSFADHKFFHKKKELQKSEQKELASEEESLCRMQVLQNVRFLLRSTSCACRSRTSR